MEARHTKLIGTERNPKYYECLCGIHVHKGAKIISIIGMIFSGFSIINTIFFGQYVSTPAPVVSFILYLFVFFANKTEKPGLYLPYLIINTIGVVLLILLSLFVIFTGSTLGLGGYALAEKERTKESYGILAATTIILGVILLVWGIVSAYFIHVVYRAYRYMKEVLLNPNTAALAHAGEV
jgi:hypothetical protein